MFLFYLRLNKSWKSLENDSERELARLNKVLKALVVYHLRGQTGRIMVLLNGSQSSGLVNNGPGIAFSTCTDQSHLPENVPEHEVASFMSHFFYVLS